MAVDKKLKYFELVEELRTSIKSGKIRPGEKIPSENQLSEQYGFSRQTVRKAIEILTEEGYVYAVHGRGTFVSELLLHSTKSNNIAVMTTYLSDYIFPRVIQGIDDVMTENGYSIILKRTNNSRSREAENLEEMIKKDIDGIIIEPSKSQIYCRHMNLYQALDNYKIPYVFIQGSYSQMEEKPHILLDDCKGGYLVTKHLIQRGHRNIVGVFKADDSQGLLRHKGYVKALQEAGISYNPDFVIWFYTEDRKSHPVQKLSQMLKLRKEVPFDAVVAYNDQIAMELYDVIEAEGLRCPEDIALTGYDDSYLAASGKIPLTTVSHPQEQLGRMAAELLIRLMNGEALSYEETHVIIQPKLVVRESS